MTDLTEEQAAQAVTELLTRANQGPGGENDERAPRSSRRDRRVTARTRAAAESAGPRPPKPETAAVGADAPPPHTAWREIARRTSRLRSKAASPTVRC
ncbi:hypothetical protein [Streptomyces sp. NPDC005408]|uniref:hypothetical protein n=1 Tax=Streptomyces sp. NPDC005408 TaxID=3155341 RepID=UPI0033ACF57C